MWKNNWTVKNDTGQHGARTNVGLLNDYVDRFMIFG